jgi:hypothetical protein
MPVFDKRGAPFVVPCEGTQALCLRIRDMLAEADVVKSLASRKKYSSLVLSDVV